MANLTLDSYTPQRCHAKDCQVEVYFSTTQGLCLKHHRQYRQQKTLSYEPSNVPLAPEVIDLPAEPLEVGVERVFYA